MNILKQTTKPISLVLGVLLFIQCSSLAKKNTIENTSRITVDKSPGYTTDIKKISTLPAFNLETGKLDDKKDSIVSIYGGNIQAKIGEINGNSIDGGDSIVAIVGKLKLNAPFEAAVKDLAKNGRNASQASLNLFSDLSEKTKVQGFALPVISSGYDSLKDGKKVDLKVYVFENVNKKVSLTAEYNGIAASPVEMETAKKSPDQARSMLSATLIKKVDELGVAIQKQLKPEVSKSPDNKVVSAPSGNTEEPITKAEPKQELSRRQKIITYVYTGAIIVSWLIGYNLPL